MITGDLKDAATVNAAGESVTPLPVGVSFRPAPTQFDDRGSVCELYDPRWGWHPEPLVFAYMFTLRPGKVKGWGMHKLHEDRYLVLFGELEVVMYDTREDSPTRGMLAKVMLTEWNRRLMNIPAGVWHANHNPGSKDAVTINFPTQPYDHANPDKYRLPLDTDQIPYKFPPQVTGW
ncbi:MAG TPA: dTDP-4-dehydrorhamnose 3,5-epimerase [Verrucomicrobiae bacterium]|nr:dTDP-4-dehydrorhamnose 3,5-epimerase [Verrucomicrobiae bacterium]